jgi:hypothetical protein
MNLIKNVIWYRSIGHTWRNAFRLARDTIN